MVKDSQALAYEDLLRNSHSEREGVAPTAYAGGG
jgi:hypothetical protein